ncbi:HD domain-containing protein [bacterium]|nr:HD domain-containing protein [bacterium]
MLNALLVRQLYESAYIQRWNDHARTIGFTELDKQAHKIVILYTLTKLEDQVNSPIANHQSHEKIIEGAIFEFLYRSVLTDIKPPVFTRLLREARANINDIVFKKLTPMLDGVFMDKLTSYFSNDEEWVYEKRLVKAAHDLATIWEFRVIYDLNRHYYGIEETKEAIESKIDDHYDLHSVRELLLNRRYYGFVDLLGQLRFQQRWTKTPRIPPTSVLGHMAVVAILSYFYTVKLGARSRRIYNNFFGGLFHDLPEVLTRDIIRPIKREISGIDLKQFERNLVEERIFPLLNHSARDEINYFLFEPEDAGKDPEFVNKVRTGETIKSGLSCREIGQKYDTNQGEYEPYDGDIIEACDDLSAFLEASLSISHGVRSNDLLTGREAIFHTLEEHTRAVNMDELNFAGLARECQNSIEDN